MSDGLPRHGAPELLADVDSEGKPICSFCRGYGEILQPISRTDHRLVCEDCESCCDESDSGPPRQIVPVRLPPPPKGQREVHVILTVRADTPEQAAGRVLLRMGKPGPRNQWRFADVH